MAADPFKPISSSASLSVESPTLPLTRGATLETATFVSLQAKLEDARGEYALRHYDAVVRILGELEMNVQTVMQTSSSGEALPDQVLLKASLLCLKGRVLSAKGAEAEAREAFTESARLFERQKSEIDGQKSATRIWTDYGMALSRLGRTQEAMDLLEQVCASGAAPPEAFGYLGFGYQQRGALAEAESAYRKGLQLIPGDPMLLRYLAETLDAAGKRGEAVAIYRDAAVADPDPQAARKVIHRALEIEPTDVQALKLAVNFEVADQQLDRGLTIVDATLQQDPHHAWALGLKGWLLRRLGKLAEAIKLFRAIEVKTPDLAWVLTELAGTLHQLDGDHDEEALELIERSSALNPQDPEPLYARAQILNDRGESAAAISTLEHALKLNPQSALLQYELGRALFLSNDFIPAEQAFDEALRLNPRLGMAVAAKATILRNKGHLDEAGSLYRRTLRLEPENEFAFQGLVRVLVDQGRVEDALKELDDRSDSCWAQWYKGEILFKQKDLKGAVQALEAARSRAPDNAGIVGQLAETLRLLDQYDAAGEVYKEFLRLVPDNAYALFRMAVYLSEIAEFKEASRHLDHAIEKAPKDRSLWNLRGWCLENLGQPFTSQACEAYEKAVSLKKEEEDDLWERKGLANTLWQLGREKQARAEFETIINEQKYKKGERCFNTRSTRLVSLPAGPL